MIVLLGSSTKLGVEALFFTFSSGVSVVSRLEKWPHKRFAYRHALEPDYSGYGGPPISSLQSLDDLSSFDRFLLGNSRRRIADICAFNVTESKQIQTCLISLDVNPSSGKMATE